MKPNLISRIIANIDRYPIWKGRWKNMIDERESHDIDAIIAIFDGIAKQDIYRRSKNQNPTESELEFKKFTCDNFWRLFGDKR